MKLRSAFAIIFIILLIDQAVKIYIKTSFPTGEVVRVMGMDWFRIHFIENPGMAWGMQLGNETGKVILTVFRLLAVIAGTWYIAKIVKEKYHIGFIICAALIYAGAAGNLIDSLFYGLFFDKGLHFDASINQYIYYDGVANLTTQGGYGRFLHGSVVDMFYFPMINGHYPNWFPWIGGKSFEFFSPIFNVADASISVGIITLLIFQKRFMKKNTPATDSVTVKTNAEVNDNTEVL